MLIEARWSTQCEVPSVSGLCGAEELVSLTKPAVLSFGRRRAGSFFSGQRLKYFATGSRYLTMSSRTMDKPILSEDSENCYQHTSYSNSYEEAMESLSSLISGQKRGGTSFVAGKYRKLERMQMYIKILDLEPYLSNLKIIHVAGTKGKGSTCSFCEAILRNCGFRTGLFTSPHLIDVRERFRIDGLDISEEKFLLYFWDCWNRLKEHVSTDLPMPPLFQFLTILAFKIFICEQVDVAIIEVGLGGLKDSTNFVKDPVVCGITSLGMDHTEVLGDTLGQIAAHKAGIFKPNIPAFTVPQLSEAMEVLVEKAHHLNVPLEVAEPFDPNKWVGLRLSLSGDHQYINAGLAVSLCKSWLQRTRNYEKFFPNEGNVDEILPEAFRLGLSTTRFSGRGQIVHDSMPRIFMPSQIHEIVDGGSLTFFLDGAHSPESMEACAKWFSSTTDGSDQVLSFSSASSGSKVNTSFSKSGNVRVENKRISGANIVFKKILLFNCMEVRDPEVLLPRLVQTCASSGTYFSKAIFVPSISTYSKVTSARSSFPVDLTDRDLSWQINLQKVWERIIHESDYAEKNSNISRETLPPCEFLFEDTSHCRAGEGYFSCSAVLSSLPLTINWLRNCVKHNRLLHIQVLVTGSLYLVGDVLKILAK